MHRGNPAQKLSVVHQRSVYHYLSLGALLLVPSPSILRRCVTSNGSKPSQTLASTLCYVRNPGPCCRRCSPRNRTVAHGATAPTTCRGIFCSSVSTSSDVPVVVGYPQLFNPFSAVIYFSNASQLRATRVLYHTTVVPTALLVLLAGISGRICLHAGVP